MKTLNSLIESRQPFYTNVLRRFKIVPEGTYLDTIKKGISQRGIMFETALIDALNDGTYNNFADPDFIGAPTLAESGIFVTGTSAGSGKFWDFLNTSLSAAGSLGDTIAKLRADITGELSPNAQQLALQTEQAKAKQTKVLTYGAIIAVLVIIAILLFKK